jgi:predicted ATPase
MKAHFLARLVGFEIGASEFLPEADPHQIQQRGIVYLGEYFKALAENKPVVILLEDLHWADDSTLDLFQHLSGSLQHTPILILGASRPGLLEQRPEWGEGSRRIHRAPD